MFHLRLRARPTAPRDLRPVSGGCQLPRRGPALSEEFTSARCRRLCGRSRHRASYEPRGAAAMGHALIPSRPESTPLFSRHFRRPPARPAAHSLWIPRLSLLRWGDPGRRRQADGFHTGAG